MEQRSLPTMNELLEKIKMLESTNNVLRQQLRNAGSVTSGAVKGNMTSNETAEFTALRRENEILRTKVTHLEKISATNSLVQSQRRLSSNSQDIAKQLLNFIEQPDEFNIVAKKKQFSNTNGSAYQGRSVANSVQSKINRGFFEPFYSNLGVQAQLRFRRALLKPKEIIHKDERVEIGTLTSSHGKNTLMVLVVLTNNTQNTIIDPVLSLSSTPDMKVTQNSVNTGAFFKSSEQWKSQITLTTSHLDFRCIAARLSYRIEDTEFQIPLILPVSRFRLGLVTTFAAMPATAVYTGKVTYLDRRVLRDLRKLGEYYPEGQLSLLNKGEFSLRIFLLRKCYLVTLGQMNEDGLRITITHMSSDATDATEAELLLEELCFILGKN